MVSSAKTIDTIRKAPLAALLIGALAIGGCASGSSSSGSVQNTSSKPSSGETGTELRNILHRSKAHVTRTGEVYLMRGLLNVFSRGMDTMAVKMRRKGLDAISYNHSNWHNVAQDILARSKKGQVSYPIVIMGHSLGGNAAPQMANFLGARGVKVSLIVAFDPTQSRSVGKNIKSVINYYLPNGKNRILRASGFTGKLTNVNVSAVPDISHTNVEKNSKFQARSIDATMRITKPLRKKRKKRTS